MRGLDPTARRLLARLRRHAPRLLVAAAAVLLVAGCQLALTWLVKLWSDALLGGAAREELARLLAGAVATTTLLVLAIFLSRHLLVAFEHRLIQELREEAGEALFRAELVATQEQPTGEWLSRLFNDASLLAGFVQDLLPRLLGGTAVIAGALVMMVIIDARLAAGIGVAVVVAAVLFTALGRRIRRWARLAQEELAEATSVAAEQLQGMPTIKAYQTERFEIDRFRAAGARYVARSLVAEGWSTALVTAVWLATAGGLLAALWYGSREVASGERRPGDLLAFALYAAQAIEPLRRLSDVQARWQRTLAAAARLFAVIDLVPEPPAAGRQALREPRGALAVERLRFAYRPGEPVLEDLSFALAAGEMAALVAASGAGKTTLAQLLLGFRAPQGGAIRFDGFDLGALDRASLRRAVGVVFQEPFLFRGTLADNLCYGAGAPPEARIRQAAEAAGLEPLLRALPRGLRSDLAETGRSLSGGERQRIALARVVLRAPALLVLDEATSTIDSETEEAILDRLQPWFAQRTVLFISHRLSTVWRQPRVLVLERGRLVGDGRPEALLAACPSFRQLFAAQAAVIA